MVDTFNTSKEKLTPDKEEIEAVDIEAVDAFNADVRSESLTIDDIEAVEPV